MTTGADASSHKDSDLYRLVEETFHRTGYLIKAVEALQRENRLLAAQLTLPDAALWKDGPPVTAPAPAVNAFPCSSVCRQEMFEQPYYRYWADQIHFVPRYHRKLWEFVYILQVLHERGVMVPGAKGLGFGVGEEPLAAYFASRGMTVVGTDMAPEEARRQGWTGTGEYAAGKAALRRPQICPDDAFEKNVSFSIVDMNHIPQSLRGFDFCWSACALEHLGSIQQGLHFIENSIETLRPGGYAIHTTELNLSSNDQTIDDAGTVLFRRRDFLAMAQKLTAAGHTVAPFDFAPGSQPMDRYVDLPPYREEPHLKLALEGYVTTSFGVIVQRGA